MNEFGILGGSDDGGGGGVEEGGGGCSNDKGGVEEREGGTNDGGGSGVEGGEGGCSNDGGGVKEGVCVSAHVLCVLSARTHLHSIKFHSAGAAPPRRSLHSSVTELLPPLPQEEGPMMGQCQGINSLNTFIRYQLIELDFIASNVCLVVIKGRRFVITASFRLHKVSLVGKVVSVQMKGRRFEPHNCIPFYF